MTREGPNSRRPELREKTTDDTRALHEAVDAIFEQPDWQQIGAQKKEILHFSIRFEMEVLEHFHPLFETLKPLAEELYNILRPAYENRNFDGLHDAFSRPLHKAAATSQTINYDKYTKALTQTEIDRRTTEFIGCGGDGGGWDLSPSMKRATHNSDAPVTPTTPTNTMVPGDPGGRGLVLLWGRFSYQRSCRTQIQANESNAELHS
jgi:hypothetical protein